MGWREVATQIPTALCCIFQLEIVLRDGRNVVLNGNPELNIKKYKKF